MSNRIELGYNLQALIKYQISLPVSITLGTKFAHLLIVGKSGSGKSTAVLYYMYQMLANSENHVVIADYKGGDEYFEFFNGSNSYCWGEKAIDLIEAYYNFFTLVRKKHITLDKHYILIIEEYRGLLAYLESKDKNRKKEIMSMIGELLAVARGLNIGIMLVMQRADATFFTAGSRENFQCMLSFGRTSKEQFSMLGFAEEMSINPSVSYDTGQAICSIDGDEPKELIVPWIKNFSEMTKCIRNLLDVQPSLHELVQAVDEVKSDVLRL